MGIETTTQAVKIVDVSSVSASEIVNDENGAWVREVKVFGPVPLLGGEPPLVFTLRMVSGEKAGLQFPTPPLAI